MNTKSFVITGFDRVASQDALILYPAGKTARALNADDYGFRNMYILVFDAEGKLYEGGYNLSAGEYSVQKNVYVPAGGFAVAFGNAHPLYQYYLLATEDAVIPNSTISLIYPMFAEYDVDVAMLKVSTQQKDETAVNKIKYLFVGNSCTYINGNPIKFKGLCKGAGIEVDVDYCTYGCAYFYEYADENHPRGIALRNMLKAKKYDYIVLQDGTPCELHRRMEALEVLLEMVKQNGAKPLLYMRYGYETDKSKRIAANADMYGTFMAMGDLYNVPVCPVAMAFTNCNVKYPDINLYADDEGHHSKEGSYLAACCFLYTFCGVSPIGNPYTAGLDEAVALKLQKTALDTCGKEKAKDITEMTKEIVKEKQKNTKPKLNIDTNNLKWGAIGAGIGIAATVAAMLIAGKKFGNKRKNKK